MVHRFVILIALGLAHAASAAPCTLAGDPELGATVAGLLATRGIDEARCAATHARIERDGDAIVVAGDGPDGVAIERHVGDPTTAATVIESWVRTDLAAPLLVAHAAAIADPLGVTAPARVAEPPASAGVHLTAAIEMSFGTDRTGSLGPAIGACIMIGKICAAARVRFARVVAGDAIWARDDRSESELLIGGDVPIHVGPVLVVPGFGGGIGMFATHVEMADMRMYSRTGGLRTDAHVAIEIPLGHALALALSAGFDITQNTHVETNTTLAFPDEPWLIGRLGAGIRYGGR